MIALGAGARAALPVAVAVFLIGISFGASARPVLGAGATIAMSLLVFGASAQFGAVAVLAAGGGPGAAVLAGSLLNARFVPMALSVAPSLSRRPLSRTLESLAVNDASWALAARGGGRFDRDALVGATLVQYPAWTAGTVLGVLGGGLLGDPAALGLDAVFPAFFLALLVTEVRRGRGIDVAAAGAAIALVLVSFVPAGVVVLAAALPALLRLRTP